MPMSEALKEATAATGVSPSDISRAQENISGHAHVTPILTSTLMDAWLSGASHTTKFFFKAECFQKTGSFKIRGALNALSNLPADDKRTVVAHSSGNHAQAVAAAASIFGREAVLVVPRGASAAKVSAVECYGARVVRCENNLADRGRVARRVVSETGGVLVHAFLNRDVVAGQGTVGAELMGQVSGVDAVVVPVGGGGLIGGVSVAVKARDEAVRVFGAEPRLADAAARSLRAGARAGGDGREGGTVADGLRAAVGEVGWEAVRRLVERVFTVDEEEIVSAMRFVWERMKVVIEPSAAVGVAAVRKEEFRQLRLGRVAVVLCGGNVDLDRLPWVVGAAAEGSG